MKACICRDISDHTVRSVLTDFFKGITIITKRRGDTGEQTQQSSNLDDLHEACSNGKGFNCGKCVCSMAELAREHNRAISMALLTDNLTPSATVAAQKEEPAL